MARRDVADGPPVQTNREAANWDAHDWLPGLWANSMTVDLPAAVAAREALLTAWLGGTA